MVRRRLTAGMRLGLAMACTVGLAGCRKDRGMAEDMDMPDSTAIMEALTDEDMQDSMLDVMPGGEMVRCDSAASERLLMEKLGTDAARR